MHHDDTYSFAANSALPTWSGAAVVRPVVSNFLALIHLIIILPLILLGLISGLLLLH